jgi:hypothetical protein
MVLGDAYVLPPKQHGFTSPAGRITYLKATPWTYTHLFLSHYLKRIIYYLNTRSF